MTTPSKNGQMRAPMPFATLALTCTLSVSGLSLASTTAFAGGGRGGDTINGHPQQNAPVQPKPKNGTICQPDQERRAARRYSATATVSAKQDEIVLFAPRSLAHFVISGTSLFSATPPHTSLKTGFPPDESKKK